MNLAESIVSLATKYRPLAEELLREVVRIPADYVDRPSAEGGDPSCGLSNHEAPRLEYLRRRILEIGAVDRPEDVGFDDFGNLWWTVCDPKDGVEPSSRKAIYLDGHSDTVAALRARWHEAIGGGIDAYDGLVDIERADRAFLRRELGYLPPEEEWEHLLWGRGSADQLGGVVAQVVATKILCELRSEGALRGAVVWSYATVEEEDNDGAGPMFLMRHVLPGAPPERIPDVVVLTEGTGHAAEGACGIYRGQRGRMQIEVEVTGKSCHGSMPWEGKNPLEYGGAILAEAAAKYEARDGFLDHEFLGHGTRTASWAHLDTPSDCAVPERFTFRFDRRLTIGERPEEAVRHVDALPGVARAREAGLRVDVRVPTYDRPSWRGVRLNNPQIYAGWITPEGHPAVTAAVAAYRDTVSTLAPAREGAGSLRREPRVSRWIFSTDGVGFPLPLEATAITVPESKEWVTSGAFRHPAMFGLGPGIEHNTHKIGECVDARELVASIAFLARFPSRFVAG